MPTSPVSRGDNLARILPGPFALAGRSDEIVVAARQANAHDFIIRLPDRYDTMVGELGVRQVHRRHVDRYVDIKSAFVPRLHIAHGRG